MTKHLIGFLVFALCYHVAGIALVVGLLGAGVSYFFLSAAALALGGWTAFRA